MAVTIMHPLVSIAVGAAALQVMRGWTEYLEPVVLRLIVESAVLIGVYMVVLLWVFNQKAKYLPMLRDSGFLPWCRPAPARGQQ